MKNIRLIIDEPQSGARNMAIDEALMLGLANSDFFGFLRFYKWDPPTLSFGYNQNIERLIVFENLNGTGLVRRMSGGKMVFHNEEWTFSLGLQQALLKSETGSTTFLQMFQRAVSPIVQALVAAGIPARFSDLREMKSSSQNNVHCYAAATGHSIFAGDKKLIGAAGIAKDGNFIIHGSIPIKVSFPPWNIFAGSTKIEAGVSMTCLSEFLTDEMIEKIPYLIGDFFSKEFNCGLIKSELSAEEKTKVEFIETHKYADLSWKEKSQKNIEKKEINS